VSVQCMYSVCTVPVDVRTVSEQCQYSVSTVYVQCMYSVCRVSVQCLYSVSTVSVQCMYSVCTVSVSVCTVSVQCLYSWLISRTRRKNCKFVTGSIKSHIMLIYTVFKQILTCL